MKWSKMSTAQKTAHSERRRERWAQLGECARERQRAKWRAQHARKRKPAPTVGGMEE